MGAVNTTRDIVLAIVLLAVMVSALITYVPAYAKYLYEGIFGKAAGYEENLDLNNAIKCAYYRCKEGCDSPNVQLIPAFGGKNCDPDFCKAEWKMADGKICGENAAEHPVVVNAGESGDELSLSGLSEFNDGCYGDYCMIGVSGTLPFGAMRDSPGFVWIRDSLVKKLIKGKSFYLSPSEQIGYRYFFSLPACTDFKTTCGAESLTIKGGTYRVWTEPTYRNARYDLLAGVWRATWGTTYIWSKGCNQQLGDECVSNADCADNPIEKICDVGRCECVPDTYCCYYGPSDDMYSYVQCLEQVGCTDIGGTFQPMRTNALTKCSNDASVCPPFDTLCPAQYTCEWSVECLRNGGTVKDYYCPSGYSCCSMA